MSARGVAVGFVFLLVVSAPRRGGAEIEPYPLHRHGRAAIAPGDRSTHIVDRSISAAGVIFLTVDGTGAPASNGVPLVGLKVVNHREGVFEVRALDNRAAPP